MTENVRRTEAVKQCVQGSQSHGCLEQIVCHSTLRGVISVLMICLFTAASVCGDFQAGVDAYERGDYETALQEFQPLAEGGDPKAQFYLGRMYARGNGVPQDDEEAAKLYREAAEGGDTIAQFVLGIWYEDGRGVPKDKGGAVKWYYKAAQQGSDLARYKLSRMFPIARTSFRVTRRRPIYTEKPPNTAMPKAQVLSWS